MTKNFRKKYANEAPKGCYNVYYDNYILCSDVTPNNEEKVTPKSASVYGKMNNIKKQLSHTEN